MSILIFLAVLFVLVLVHELGHFAMAKWTGMRVDEFGIGFPPKLFGITRGETEYSFNLFPIGGFVKIFGEDSLVEDEVKRDYSNRSFISKSKRVQAGVLVAGVAMNVLFAWVIAAFAFGIGVQSAVPEEEAKETAKLTITQVLPDSPAERAGLPSGAIIKAVSGGTAELFSLTPSSFSNFIEAHANQPITIAYLYKDELRMSELRPETGIIENAQNQPAVGVTLALVDVVSRPIVTAMADAFMYVANGLRDITAGIGKLLYQAVKLEADFSQVAGPVGIVGLVGEASEYGFTSLLMFTAFISLNLAVINILPFPALDGGRLLFVGIETIKGSPIRPQYVAFLNTLGFFLLIMLMVAVTWNDIIRLWQG
jgi:regulator of sigma E protease